MNAAPNLQNTGISRLGVIFAALAIITVGGSTLAMRPAVGRDAAKGMIAAEQQLLGRGSSLQTVTVADDADLTRDRLDAVSWSPPGQQAVFYAVRKTGATLGQALRAIVLVAWIVGLSAWALYFRLALDDLRLWPWLVGAFALFRGCYASAFEYAGGESLMWAAVPIVALINLRAMRSALRGHVVWAAVAGVITGALVLIEYAGAIVCLGVAAAWARPRDRGESTATYRAAGVWASAAIVGATIVYVSIATALSGPHPATSLTTHPLISVIGRVAGPLMSILDVADMATTWTNRRGLPPLSERSIGVLAIGIGLVFMLWFATSASSSRARGADVTSTRGLARRLGVSVAVVTALVLMVLLFRGAQITWHGPYQQLSAFLLLPFLADRLNRAVRRGHGWRGTLSAACALMFLGAPTVYGAVGLVNKAIWRTSAVRSGLTASGVPLSWAAERGGEAFRQEVIALPGFKDMLLATSSPTLALAFPESRLLLTEPLRQYHGRPAGGVLIVQTPFMAAEDLEVLKQNFVDVTRWTRVELQSVPGAHLWRSQ